ncbi:MAG: hypothetical protein AAGK71_06580 [Pseudomonadota bacterium]
MSDALLAKIDRLQDWIAATPGACNGGRAMATDDPDVLGWDVIAEHLKEDGVFVFRHMPPDMVPVIEARVSELDCALHQWNVFHATVEEVASRRSPKPTPADHTIATETKPDHETVQQATDFLASRGLRPFTPRVLAGDISASALVTARNTAGRLTAVAFGHMPFTAPSRWTGMGWCGLVAVDETARGTGLGRAVNDASIDAMLHSHGAGGVFEYAAADNTASRRMIEGSGLRLRDDLVTCAATAGSTPYTR